MAEGYIGELDNIPSFGDIIRWYRTSDLKAAHISQVVEVVGECEDDFTKYSYVVFSPVSGGYVRGHVHDNTETGLKAGLQFVADRPHRFVFNVTHRIQLFRVTESLSSSDLNTLIRITHAKDMIVLYEQDIIDKVRSLPFCHLTEDDVHDLYNYTYNHVSWRNKIIEWTRQTEEDNAVADQDLVVGNFILEMIREHFKH